MYYMKIFWMHVTDHVLHGLTMYDMSWNHTIHGLGMTHTDNMPMYYVKHVIHVIEFGDMTQYWQLWPKKLNHQPMTHDSEHNMGMHPMAYEFWEFGIWVLKTSLLAYDPGFWQMSRRLAYEPGFWRMTQGGWHHARVIWHMTSQMMFIT